MSVACLTQNRSKPRKKKGSNLCIRPNTPRNTRCGTHNFSWTSRIHKVANLMESIPSNSHNMKKRDKNARYRKTNYKAWNLNTYKGPEYDQDGDDVV